MVSFETVRTCRENEADRTSLERERGGQDASPLFNLCSYNYSVQVEIHFHYDLHSHGVPVVHGGREPVLPHGFDGLLIEAHAKVFSHVDVLRIALCIHDELNGAGTLVARLPSLFREFRLYRVNYCWCANAAANAHYAAAIATAAPGSHSRTVPSAEPTAQPMAK